MAGLTPASPKRVKLKANCMAESPLYLMLVGFVFIFVGLVVLIQGGNPSGSGNILPIFGGGCILGGILAIAAAAVALFGNR